MADESDDILVVKKKDVFNSLSAVDEQASGQENYYALSKLLWIVFAMFCFCNLSASILFTLFLYFLL